MTDDASKVILFSAIDRASNAYQEAFARQRYENRRKWFDSSEARQLWAAYEEAWNQEPAKTRHPATFHPVTE